jgi:glutamine amidotransferase
VTRDVTIVDSGGANIASLQHALARLGASSHVSNDASEIAAARRVLLPGVGSAEMAMQRLRDRELDRLLPTLTQPVLGICLGMQLLYEHSAEGDTACLGILSGAVVKLPAERGRPVPHMGWNTLQRCRQDATLAGLGDDDRVYFVHSYAAPVTGATTASCDYGREFAAVVAQGNFHGVQFHPERSGPVGARLLGNFLRN